MAIFVIVVGVLLMLGGATALLFGFDIVMTERGSAMAIGGTVTLSGGAITIGVGFALLKLNQIVRVLDLRSGNMQRPMSSGERPVVPTPMDETIAPTQAAVAQKPLSTLAGVAAAGVAVAGVAAVGYSTVSKSNVDPSPSDDANLSDLDAIALAVETPVESNDSYFKAPSPASVSSPDLEAELSRALAETDNHADQDRQFTSGLTEFLSKPKAETIDSSQVEKLNEPLSQDDADLSENDLTEAALSNAVDEEITQQAGLQSTTLDYDADGDSTASTEAEQSDLDLEGLQDNLDANDENNSLLNGAKTPNDGTLQESDTLKRDILRPGILRTYSANGKSYTIYVDGTVEAATDEGVEHFASMDEFRSHLAKI